MIYLFTNAKLFLETEFRPADILVANERIEFIGEVNASKLRDIEIEVEIIDCEAKCIIPGIVDPHAHLSGGSGEKNGFASQSLPILVSECVRGGVTTIVGTIGVDTSTKTMPDLLAKVKAYNEVGLTAFAYTGGYDIPPKTITDSVRNDLLFIQEIIGVGEISIADRRAPEPNLDALARASIDAYVGGMLSGKCGVSHFHVGEGERRLKTVRDLLANHEILPEKIYLTHIERSQELVQEAIELAHRGCYVDFDSHDRDFGKWFKTYRDKGGPMNKMTVSSDAGVLPPCELWDQLRDCVFDDGHRLEDLLPHFTLYPAQALGLKKKGRLQAGADADLVVFDPKSFAISEVMARGKFFVRNSIYTLAERKKSRRDADFYGLVEKKSH